MIEIVVSIKHLESWRAQKVYNPHVVRTMWGAWDDSDQSRLKAERMATVLRAR